jgi:hypothetical protein
MVSDATDVEPLYLNLNTFLEFPSISRMRRSESYHILCPAQPPSQILLLGSENETLKQLPSVDIRPLLPSMV